MEFFQNKKFNKLIYSVVALTMMLLLLFTATYAWLSSGLSANMNSNDYITIDPDSGLEMNYGTEDMNQSSIDINKVVSEDFMFYECSSYDGKRVFFPLSEYNANPNDSAADQDFVTNVNTKDFIYREATENDKNTKYISIDLTLSSKSQVPIYISEDTRVSGAAAGAIRMAFIDNSPNGKSLVFDNTKHQNELVTNDCVQSLRNDGSPNAIAAQPINALASYVFGNEFENALFTLEAGVEKSITVVIWLEGTDAQCTSAVAGLSDLEIYIQFSTTSEDTKTFYFIDQTLEDWVSDEGCFVYAINQAGRKTEMSSTDGITWSVDLPVSTSSIRFARYNPKLHEGNPEEWNYWDAGEVGECTTYNAYAHNTGIWSNDFQREIITFYDTLPDNCTITKVNEAYMYVQYSVVDGNGIEQAIEHKMSYPSNNRWQIVIPKEVSIITFNWYKLNADKTTDFNTRYLYWENTERGDSTVFNAFDYSVGIWDDNFSMDTITFSDASSQHYLRDSIEAGNDDAIYARFYVTDGNGNDVECIYKMDSLWDRQIWQVKIPSFVNDIEFLWWNNSKTGNPSEIFYATDRGDSQLYTAHFYESEDYWASRILYVDTANAAVEDNVIYAAYFFNDDGDYLWTGMNATTTSGKYMVGVPEGYDKVIFCRACDYLGYFEFEDPDSVYNQTYDLTIGSADTYIISGYTDEYIGDRNYMSGYWSTRTIYVDASAAYAGDEVMYAAYFFGGNGDPIWTGMRATTSEGKYIVGVPEGYNNVIFCRRSESAGPFDWNIYNQTFDITLGSHNTYIISGYTSNGNNLDGYWDTNS